MAFPSINTTIQGASVVASSDARIYCVQASERAAEWCFIVSGTSGTPYHVSVGKKIRCTCKDFQCRSRQSFCNHVSWVIIKKLRLSMADIAVLHGEFLTGEIICTKFFSAFQAPKEFDLLECAVCMELLANPAVHCHQCKGALHKACFDHVARFPAATCPYCHQAFCLPVSPASSTTHSGEGKGPLDKYFGPPSKKRKTKEIQIVDEPKPAALASTISHSPSEIAKTVAQFSYFPFIEMVSAIGPVMISGAAEGADSAWAVEGQKHGHAVVHMSFEKHVIKAGVPGKVFRLSDSELKVADVTLLDVARRLGRKFSPGTGYICSLLRRNYHQVSLSTSLYAVGQFDSTDTTSPCASLRVVGGTAWACQTFAEKTSSYHADILPLYFFDQTSSKWYQPYLISSRTSFVWQPISEVPVPTGIYTAIGTRELTQSGRDAIRMVYKS
eukprot:TRINITY_DN1994_c0_g1_i1.p1 TRINITY_DN1994_c0_g1~~TRINITY_DN1994_c0_g1_i1.p1  ORF type:complete len:442 (-),score=31.73 TRINITY_DN1994_c0_g1_i1:281-1606(-)